MNDTDLMPELLLDARNALAEVYKAVVLDGNLQRTVERLARAT
jgi:hypothetical protein